MPALKVSPAQRADLRSQAHALKPVVLIGAEGLTDAVLAEIKVHLAAHELIKIRVFGDERDERLAIYEAICDTLSAAPIQHIGKLLVIWKPQAAPAAKTTGARAAGAKTAGAKSAGVGSRKASPAALPTPARRLTIRVSAAPRRASSKSSSNRSRPPRVGRSPRRWSCAAMSALRRAGRSSVRKSAKQAPNVSIKR